MLGLINTGRATQACGWCQGLSIRSGYLGPVPAAGYLDGQSSGRIYPWIYQFRPRLYVQSSNGCNLAPKSSFIRSCKQGLKRFQRPPRRSLHGPFFGRLLSQGSPILANYPGLVLGSLGRTIWPRRRSVWSLRSSPVSKRSSPISKTQCCCPTSTSVCPGNNSLCLGIICERLGISRSHLGANLDRFWYQKSTKIHPKIDSKRHQKINNFFYRFFGHLGSILGPNLGPC